MLAQPKQRLDVRAGVRKIVLAMDFEPADCGLGVQQFALMLSPQADPGRNRDRPWDTRCVVRGHRYYLADRLPPTMRSQVPFGSLIHSLPEVALDCPAQACAGPAQSFLPACAMP